jgi:hypothetical protein
MRHTVALAAIMAVALTACSHGHADLRKPATQDDFGVQMAKMNLWREAMFRFQRAVELNPGDAMAHNNLAVAYEANGEFEKAAREYREALKLDRSNQYIQKNYSRYTEFISRNRKRQQRQDTKASNSEAKPAANSTAAGPAAATPAGTLSATPAASPVAATPPATPPATTGAAPALPASTAAAPPVPPPTETSSAPAAPTSNPPAQTPPAQSAPAQNPPPPPAASPSTPPGGTR